MEKGLGTLVVLPRLQRLVTLHLGVRGYKTQAQAGQ